jgi:hypothetical protein
MHQETTINNNKWHYKVVAIDQTKVARTVDGLGSARRSLDQRARVALIGGRCEQCGMAPMRLAPFLCIPPRPRDIEAKNSIDP